MHDEKTIYDNQVAEKAIWEETATEDVELLQSPTRNVVTAVSSISNTPSIAAKNEAQPQMMFCYKCNNVIPNDSKFCPYCQIELFVICPKCGVKYSSQYPACNQCGTNRIEYLQIEKERKERERIEREERERIKREERERIERERREKEERKRIKREEKQRELAAYKAENERIKETEEYKNTYSLLTKAQGALKRYNFIIKIKKSLYLSLINTIKIIISILYAPIFIVGLAMLVLVVGSILLCLPALISGITYEFIERTKLFNDETAFPISAVIFLIIVAFTFNALFLPIMVEGEGSIFDPFCYPYKWLWKDGRWKKEEIWEELEDRKKRLFLIKYISKRSNYYHKTIPFLVENYIKKDDLTNCCINAYRKKRGLPIE